MKFDELRGLVDSGYQIRVDPVSELTLSYLMNLAEKALGDSPKTEEDQEVTVVITARDKIYTGTASDPQWVARLTKALEEQGDTQVTHLVTMIRSCTDTTGVRQGLDLPSYTFRNMLVDLDERNESALLVLQGHDCLRARTIGSTMPQKKNAG